MTPRIFRQTGAALVVVLSLLVLLTVLALAYFMSVETETQNSASTRSLAVLRQLSDIPLQIVQTQIRAATTNGQTSQSSGNSWTSQPGLLRVSGSAGGLVRAYKLYSSSTLDTDDDAFIGTEIPEDWPDHPNQWVNLNEPYLSTLQPGRKIWPVLNPTAGDWAEGVAVSADPAGKAEATMPVEWLYVLADGSVLPQSELSADRLPVGRIAFWTDDESCKININTAGERTMWDRPRSYHELREKYGRNQPSTGEFNAYPGHPATVSLSAVFGKALAPKTDNQIVEKMLSLTPRYRWGGSENGTRTIWDRADEWKLGNLANVNKQERLYATPPELLLNVTREIITDNNESVAQKLRQSIEESGFVLTEASRSPELNVFGMPRVGMWPIDTNPAKQTAHDKLIARCLTVGEKPFYFQRSNPLSDNEAAIARNTGLLEYLDRLTQRPVNGFGGSFEEKWGADERRQVLTEIFDYVRGATNLSDTSRSLAEYGKQFTPISGTTPGYVIPTKIAAWNTRGLGRAPVLTHAALVFYAYEQQATAVPPATPEGSKSYVYDTKVHAMLWFNFFNPMYGLAPITTQYRISVTSGGLPIREIGAPAFSNLIFLGTSSNKFIFPRTSGADVAWGGYQGMSIHGTSTMAGFKNYELHSSVPVTIKGRDTGPAMEFGGAPMKIELIDNGSNTVLQTYDVEFDSCLAPLPLLWAGGWDTDSDGVRYFNPVMKRTWTEGQNTTTMDVNPLEISERIAKIWDSSGRNLLLGSRRFQPKLDPVDVIRTMEIRHGDGRLMAGLSHVDASQFVPGFGYNDGSRRISGSLLFSRTDPVQEEFVANEHLSQFGRQVDVKFKTSYNNIESAVLPKTFNGKEVTSLRAVGWSGDLDNGFLGEPDGPYANKPDEGHSIAQTLGTGLPYYSQGNAQDESGLLFRSWDPRINGFFSPTRQVPSPVMFGSLPTGVKRTAAAYSDGKPKEGRPWETLLFSPNSQAAMMADGDGNIGHPGASAPKDHLLLDLFTMPVVEPYAISEPFSTAGKINLNQRLIPFTHLKRETGLHGVLKNLEFMAIPNTQSLAYRSNNPTANSIRKIDTVRTLREIAKVLDPDGETGKGAFRSASEICNVFLVPQNQTGTNVVNWTTDDPAAFWSAHQLTGDNSREAPYNYLYPLLTTQSNSYQVHYRVQTLQPLKRKAGFDPANDFAITGEQRGSFVLERYLDSNDPRFSGNSPEVNADTTPLTPYYQFRTLRHQRFVPGL